MAARTSMPIHFGEGKQTIDRIPVDKFVGPAVVIDVSAAVAKDRDYSLAPSDIIAWEAKHGQVPAGSIVLVRTGWEKHWGDKLAYLGTDKPGDTANLHFPGISEEAAVLLGERKVDAIGLDTPSLDHGPSRDFAAHRAFAAAEIYGLECGESGAAAAHRRDPHRPADEDQRRDGWPHEDHRYRPVAAARPTRIIPRSAMPWLS